MSFNPSNVKVHFAGYDNDERAIAVLKAAGVRYRRLVCVIGYLPATRS